MRLIILALAMLPLTAACSRSGPVEQQLGVREAAALEKALAGKVAGEPVSCITSYNANKLRILGDNVVIYRADKDLTYRNNLEGHCSGLAQGNTLILTRRTSSLYCRGDMAEVVDLMTGTTRGFCALGPFVPYRTAAK